MVLTFSTENLSGKIMLRKFSITSQLEIAFPATVAGICTDKTICACGLRYKLCGKYNGTQSTTFFTVCIFIVSSKTFVVDVVDFLLFLKLFFVLFRLINIRSGRIQLILLKEIKYNWMKMCVEWRFLWLWQKKKEKKKLLKIS